jgi:hypothetical protein
VSGYSVVEGRAVSHYVHHPDAKPDFSLVNIAEYGSQVVQWRGAPPRAREVPEDTTPQPGYIGITRGLEEEPRPEVVAAIRSGTRITSELVHAAARSIEDVHPLQLEPLEVRAERGKPVHVHEDVNMITVYTLVFDGPYGEESKEFRSIRDAQEYPQVLRDYFKRDCFSNFRLFRESRSPREQLSFGE